MGAGAGVKEDVETGAGVAGALYVVATGIEDTKSEEVFSLGVEG